MIVPICETRTASLYRLLIMFVVLNWLGLGALSARVTTSLDIPRSGTVGEVLRLRVGVTNQNAAPNNVTVKIVFEPAFPGEHPFQIVSATQGTERVSCATAPQSATCVVHALAAGEEREVVLDIALVVHGRVDIRVETFGSERGPASTTSASVVVSRGVPTSFDFRVREVSDTASVPMIELSVQHRGGAIAGRYLLVGRSTGGIEVAGCRSFGPNVVCELNADASGNVQIARRIIATAPITWMAIPLGAQVEILKRLSFVTNTGDDELILLPLNAPYGCGSRVDPRCPFFVTTWVEGSLPGLPLSTPPLYSCQIGCSIAPRPIEGFALERYRDFPQGALLNLPSHEAKEIYFFQRAGFVSAAGKQGGTSIPIPRSRDFRSERLILGAVPAAAGTRVSLRIYSISPVPVEVLIQVLRSGLPVASRVVTLSEMKRPTRNAFGEAGRTELHDFFGSLGLPPGGVYSIDLIPLSERASIWAFASSTDNVTQHITVVAPD